MEKYIKLLALVFLLFGIFGSISGIIILITYQTTILENSWIKEYLLENETKEYRGILNLIFYFPLLITSFGIYAKKIWGRTLGIVWSALNVALFPYGTILALYSLWVLLNKKTKRLFNVPDSSLI